MGWGEGEKRGDARVGEGAGERKRADRNPEGD